MIQLLILQNGALFSLSVIYHNQEMFEGARGIIKNINWRTDTTMANKIRSNGQTKIYKTLHWKLKIKQSSHRFDIW